MTSSDTIEIGLASIQAVSRFLRKTVFDDQEDLGYSSTSLSSASSGTAMETNTAVSANTSFDSFDSHDNYSSGGNAQGISLVGVILVVSFTVLVNLAFFVPAYFARRRSLRLLAQTAAARSLANSVQEDERLARMNCPQARNVRYGNIESWMYSRSVLHHDALCQKLRQAQQTFLQANNKQRRYSKKRTSTLDTASFEDDEGWGCLEAKTERLSDKNSVDDDDNNSSLEQAECPVCFDHFLPGDICSWSLDPSCRHVFHHLCIKEWLLKHESCPFCRATFLPIDEQRLKRSSSHHSASAMQQVNLLMLAHNERSRSCFYCHEHGIVYLPTSRPSSLTLAEWQTLGERATCMPTRDELKRLRASEIDNKDKKEEAAEEGDAAVTDVTANSIVDEAQDNSVENTTTAAVEVGIERSVRYEEETSSSGPRNASNRNEDDVQDDNVGMDIDDDNGETRAPFREDV